MMPPVFPTDGSCAVRRMPTLRRSPSMTTPKPAIRKRVSRAGSLESKESLAGRIFPGSGE
jgi:hypothetical protein